MKVVVENDKTQRKPTCSVAYNGYKYFKKIERLKYHRVFLTLIGLFKCLLSKKNHTTFLPGGAKTDI